MPRLRELGYTPGYLPTATHNAITDVPGLLIGHVTRIEGDAIRTGVTAILPHQGSLYERPVAAAVYTINGYGKAHGFEQVRELGRIETPIILTNTLSVGQASAALTAYMLERHPDLMSINPVVGECNDGLLNDIRGQHIRAQDIFDAIDHAASGHVAEGNVGAGTGTSCYQFKGGIGTASRRVDGHVVGALVQTNFGTRRELRICGVPIGERLRDQYMPRRPAPGGSVMIVLATDKPLDSRQLLRLAKRAPFALGRTGTTGHHGSGDFVIAFSTTGAVPGQPGPAAPADADLDSCFDAAVESIEEAIYNALTAAETLRGRDGATLHALPLDTLTSMCSD